MPSKDQSPRTVPVVSLALALALAMVVPGSAAAVAEPGLDSPRLDGFDTDLLEDPCSNYGFVIVVSVTGSATYCKGAGACDNHGYIVAAGADASACGYRGVLVVCKAGDCYNVGGHPDPQGTSGLALNAEGPCGVAEEPVCWTTRFTCPWWGPTAEDTWEQVLGPYVEAYLRTCECQPGDQRCEPDTAARLD